jgi:hypothetical protein
MKGKIVIASFGLVATAALAGAYDQPWAVIESGKKSDTKLEHPIAITKVDGADVKTRTKTGAIAPGAHTVTFYFHKASSGKAGVDTRDLQMNLEGCTRYRVVAALDSKTATNWEPKVYPEPIGECQKKFKTAAATK